MIRHIAGIADIVDDVEGAVAFYRDTLGLSVEYNEGDNYATIKIPGVLHFGIWGRAAAASSMYGDAEATDRIPLGITVGFEVDDVETVFATVADRGLTVLQKPKREPWGQVTSRFALPGGTIGEVCETPWARHITAGMQAEGTVEA